MANCHVRWRGLMEYTMAATEMAAFTDQRDAHSDDQIWILEHAAVFTQGTSCHTLPRTNPSSIPVVHSSRGGQMTYHGPGQLIVYFLLDLKRMGIGPKSLVASMESCLINLLNQYGLVAQRRPGAPGVYVNQAKIAALGFRIRRGKCFHGISINVNMMLQPFEWIDPCGYPNLAVTQLADQGLSLSLDQTAQDLLHILEQEFYWEQIIQTVEDEARVRA